MVFSIIHTDSQRYLHDFIGIVCVHGRCEYDETKNKIIMKKPEKYTCIQLDPKSNERDTF